MDLTMSAKDAGRRTVAAALRGIDAVVGGAIVGALALILAGLLAWDRLVLWAVYRGDKAKRDKDRWRVP